MEIEGGGDDLIGEPRKKDKLYANKMKEYELRLVYIHPHRYLREGTGWRFCEEYLIWRERKYTDPYELTGALGEERGEAGKRNAHELRQWYYQHDLFGCELEWEEEEREEEEENSNKNGTITNR